MKKILFFIESLAGGGAEKVLTDIVKNLNNKEYDITVMTVTDSGLYVNDIKSKCKYKSFLKVKDLECGIFNKLKYKFLYKAIYNLPTKIIYKIFIKQKYDIEIGFVEGFSTKLIAKSKNKHSKKIAWIHTDFETNHWTRQVFKNDKQEKESYLKYDKIITVSKSAESSFKRELGIKHNIYTQYNPIDIKNIKLKSKEPINIKKVNGKLTLCTVGRLVDQKGYDRLLNVVKRLKEDNLEFNLWIIGQGIEYENLNRYIIDNNLQDIVNLLGFKKNPYKYVSKADVFICSSRAEGFSLAIAEAMTLGVPIISTNCSGPNEILGFGKYGLLVENSEDELYKGLKKLIIDSSLRKIYKEKARNRSLEFDINNTIKNIEKVF